MLLTKICLVFLLLVGCALLVIAILIADWVAEKLKNRKSNLKNNKRMEEKKSCAECAESPKMYTEAELVSFGNYLLEQVYSGERFKKFDDLNLMVVVGDWDIANWKDRQ